MKFPPRYTQRLCLRAFNHSDLRAFTAYRAHPDVARYQSWDTYNLEMAQQFWDSQSNLCWATPGSWYQIAIADQDTQALLGDCAVHFLDDQQVELGITLSPEVQGTGIAREALDALIAFLFLEGRYHRISAITDARNNAAARLLSRLGFRQEAHWKAHVMFKGQWCDEFGFAMLRDEWLSHNWYQRISLSPITCDEEDLAYRELDIDTVPGIRSPRCVFDDVGSEDEARILMGIGVDERPAGLVVLSRQLCEQHMCWVEDFQLLPALRKKHLLPCLMEFICGYARQLGAQRLALQLDERNQLGLSAVRKAGFTRAPQGHWVLPLNNGKES